MQIQKAAVKLLKLSPSVRVVTVCDKNGKVVYSAHSRRVRNLLTKKESMTSLRLATQAWKVRKSFARRLGQCKYVVAEYGRIKRITMPAGKDHLFYITTSVAYDHNKIIHTARRFR